MRYDNDVPTFNLRIKLYSLLCRVQYTHPSTDFEIKKQRRKLAVFHEQSRRLGTVCNERTSPRKTQTSCYVPATLGSLSVITTLAIMCHVFRSTVPTVVVPLITLLVHATAVLQ